MLINSSFVSFTSVVLRLPVLRLPPLSLLHLHRPPEDEGTGTNTIKLFLPYLNCHKLRQDFDALCLTPNGFASVNLHHQDESVLIHSSKHKYVHTSVSHNASKLCRKFMAVQLRQKQFYSIDPRLQSTKRSGKNYAPPIPGKTMALETATRSTSLPSSQVRGSTTAAST